MRNLKILVVLTVLAVSSLSQNFKSPAKKIWNPKPLDSIPFGNYNWMETLSGVVFEATTPKGTYDKYYKGFSLRMEKGTKNLRWNFVCDKSRADELSALLETVFDNPTQARVQYDPPGKESQGICSFVFATGSGVNYRWNRNYRLRYRWQYFMVISHKESELIITSDLETGRDNIHLTY
jgi:hypothetical protein